MNDTPSSTASVHTAAPAATPTVESRPIEPRIPVWPRPSGPAGSVALTAAVIGGATAALALPWGRPGLGWPLTGAVLAALSWRMATRTATGTGTGTDPRSRPVTALWATASLGLLGIVAWRASDWLAPLCLLCAAVAASLAVAGGRSGRGLVLGVVAVPVLALPALPWAGRGLAALAGSRRGSASAPTRSPARVAVAALAGVALLLVFAPLLAGADPAFGRLLDGLLPTLDLSAFASAFRRAFLFALFGLGTLGAAYRLSAPTPSDRPRPRAGKLRRIEWALPVGLLVALFATFVGVALSSMFGGEEHVLRTTGLTYAEYARTGFWQLLAVTVLTLPVIMVAAREARTATVTDRAWLRGLLGALAGLTLLIVASAMSRMWAYQQAYGFTVLRVLVSTMELWLGLVYVLLLFAGRRLAAPWMPQAILGTGLAALLALGVANPDRFISDRNVARWEQTGRIDLRYLSRLSADAVPALERLPEPMRACALAPIAADLATSPDGWREWNAGRASGRASLTGLGPPPISCGPR